MRENEQHNKVEIVENSHIVFFCVRFRAVRVHVNLGGACTLPTRGGSACMKA
jgi:hypothetical protein